MPTFAEYSTPSDSYTQIPNEQFLKSGSRLPFGSIFEELP